MANTSDILKDRRVIIGGSVAALFLLGGAAFYFLGPGNSGGGGDQAATPAAPAAPPGAPPAGGAPAPAPAAGAPGAPVAGAPGAPGAGAPKTAAATAPVRNMTDSFAGAPEGYGGAAGGAAAPAGPAAPGGGGAAGGGPLDKLDPIKRGLVEAGYRADPFVSLHRLVNEKPAAYTLVAPIRLASRVLPGPAIDETLAPELRLGPLPPVERRIAGVLYDGSVSAILETGTPGSSSTDVRVIQPGLTVPSGVPGIDDLTVASITPTGALLRATDGRTVTVKLSAVPAAYADAFHQAANGGAGGGAPGVPPGAPGGGGAPGAPVAAP